MIVPLNVFARPKALFQDSFNGLRFRTAAFTTSISGWSLQLDETRKECGILTVLNRTVDPGPTKSGINEVGRTFARAGFWIGVSSSER